MKSKDLLETLLAEELSSVEFVQDYLQLHFQDRTLTCYIWPSVKVNHTEYEINNIDYRNKLCDCIGKEVVNVLLIQSTSLTIEFMNSYSIILLLDPRNPEIVSEIAILSDDDNNWSVFD
jgi:hypothetical protein